MRDAKTCNVRIESKVYGGETFGRYLKALSLFLCAGGKAEGIRNYFNTYLE